MVEKEIKNLVWYRKKELEHHNYYKSLILLYYIMKKEEVTGRLVEFMLLFASLLILSYGLNLSKINIFSFVSFIFLIGGASFEFFIRRTVKRKGHIKKENSFLQAVRYIHFMPGFQKYYGDLYAFRNYKELEVNVLAFFFVFIYILIVWFLFSYVGEASLLIYVLPAITNLVSFFRNR